MPQFQVFFTFIQRAMPTKPPLAGATPSKPPLARAATDPKPVPGIYQLLHVYFIKIRAENRLPVTLFT